MRTWSGFADGAVQPDGLIRVYQVLIAAACMISCDRYLWEGRARVDILPGDGCVRRYWVSFIISLLKPSIRALLDMGFERAASTATYHLDPSQSAGWILRFKKKIKNKK